MPALQRARRTPRAKLRCINGHYPREEPETYRTLQFLRAWRDAADRSDFLVSSDWREKDAQQESSPSNNLYRTAKVLRRMWGLFLLCGCRSYHRVQLAILSGLPGRPGIGR